MEAFRGKYQPGSPPRRFLLPISFGVSSIALLHVLDQHVSGQLQKSGRASYALHVVHVAASNVSDEDESESRLEAVKARFPQHSYSTVQLSDVMTEPDIKSLASDNETDVAQPLSNEEKLQRLLSSATSATARADILTALRTRSIAAAATRHNCDTILWGDSTTRLAEKTLAETAKGRGFALPWSVGEEAQPHAAVGSQYPMRDLLKKELVVFAETTEPSLTGLVRQETSKPAVSARNSTIDELMAQYFESVEREYPSIVANVVRTIAKLQLPADADMARRCKLCRVPITEQRLEPQEGVVSYCSNCARALPNLT